MTTPVPPWGGYVEFVANPGGALPTFPSGPFDLFNRTGNLNGSVSGNGVTWTNYPGTTGNTTALATTATAGPTGRMGQSGTPNNGLFVAFNAPVTARKWLVSRGDTVNFAGGVAEAHNITYDGAGTWDRLTWRMATVGSTSIAYNFGKAVAATAVGTPLATVTFTGAQAGDVHEARYYQDGGGNTLADLYLNGFLQFVGAAVTTGAAITVTGVYGFNGNCGANVYRYFECGDPDTQGMIRLFAPWRVQQLQPNGDLVYYPSGDFSQASMSRVTYTLFDLATDAAVAGQVNQPVAGLVAGGGSWLANPITVPAASVPATGYYFQFTRNDTTPDPMRCWSPVHRSGKVYFGNGQSLQVQAETSTAGLTITNPANCWYVDASQGVDPAYVVNSANIYDCRVAPPAANTAMAMFFATMQLPGAVPVAWGRGGLGGTTAFQRLPPSQAYLSLIQGLKRAGGVVKAGVDNSGQYDGLATSGPGSTADYTANLNTTYAQVETDLGMAAGSLPIMYCGISAVRPAGGSDLSYQDIRNQQLKLGATGRGRRGPDLWHLQHKSNAGTGDQFHLTPFAYSEQMRLVAMAMNDLEQGGTLYKRGPTFNSVAKVDDQTITILLDCPNASSLTTVTPGGATNALNFATSGANYDAGIFVTPTTVTFGAVAANQCLCTATFPAGTWTGIRAFVGSAWGRNPGNPTDNNAIEIAGVATNQPTATGKTWYAGVYAGEQNVPIQAFYDTVNNHQYLQTNL